MTYEYINCYLELRMCLVIAGCGYILLFRKPGTRIAILKVLIWCQIWPLQLEMKSNTVLITVIDNAKMLFEAGRMNVVD